MEIEDILEIIGGKKQKQFLSSEITGIYSTWALENIKNDGVYYNLFKKKDSWSVSKIITLGNDEMEFENFNTNEDMLLSWLTSEFIEFVRNNTINNILN